MEDLADALKRHYFGLYKKKADIFGSVQQRVQKMNDKRKSNRRQEIFDKRRIPVNMSPIFTPTPKRSKTAQKRPEQPKVEAAAMEAVPNKRLEMLMKWKEEKERRVAAQKQNAKPLFKVCHIPVSVGLPNLENVNKEIKGKAFKSKFAPDNHKFHAPANVKAIDFNKAPNSTKKKTEAPARHRMITRSRTGSSAVPSTPMNLEKGKTKTPKKTKPAQKKEKAKEAKDTNIKPKAAPDCPNTEPTTPQKTEPPAYVSPFVTISRGKDSARKEYAARRSRQSLSAQKGGPIDCTSPRAGAAYFRWRLNTQISRLQELCDQWNKYKAEDSPPEEAFSMIDVAVGQTNLLLTKKFVQFKGLIDQCDDVSGGTSVRCEDLHGFWDMIYIQVENLDKRFENLANLRANNWEEILPDVAEPVVPKKGRPVRNAKASAGLKAAIQAARRRKNGGENTERKTPQSRRSSHRVDAVRSEDKRKSGSPGLMMMKVAQYAKTVETPGRSILKSDVRSAVKSQTKMVLFKDEIDENVNTENDLSKSIQKSRVKTPGRRSTRLSKTKLF